MKLSNFLVGTLVCAMAAACTNDTYEDGNENNQAGNGEQAFIAVNLVAPSAMTRTFQNGTDAENKVTTARFYFFSDNGNAVNVTTENTTEVNYINVSSPTFNSSTGNVEETSNTILVLKGENNAWPSRMVVILNPPTTLSGNKDLSDLTTSSADYSAATSGNFIMSNSVYKDSNNGTVTAVDISDNITNNQDAAEANPVDVYVERTVARVDVKINNNDITTSGEGANNSMTTGVTNGDIEGTESSASSQTVNAAIKGWAIANRSAKSYLIKNLNNNWVSSGADNVPFNSWNDAGNFRSYWAACPSDMGMMTNLTYSQIDEIADINTSQYCQERTNATTTGTASTYSPTELVVIAELQINGTAQTIAKYAGRYWTLEALKEQIANMIVTGDKPIYYSTNGSTDWTALSKDLIIFRPRTESEKDTYEAYQSIPDLTTAAQSYTFSSSSEGLGTENANKLEVSEVQAILANYVALVWDDGKTYYHVPIQHNGIGTENALEAVVRNHLYNINITGVTGLGTPIPGPETGEPGTEEPIDPEDPEEEESFLAAQINILSWNVIGQNVNLGGSTSAPEQGGGTD